MHTFFIYFRGAFRRLWLYSLVFVSLFTTAFLPHFTDSAEAKGMFGLFSIFLQVPIITLFPLAIAVLYYFNVKVNPIAKALILYLVAEASFFLFIGNPSLFGLFETKPTYSSSELQTELLDFHKSRDFALSMSSLISVAIYFAYSVINTKKEKTAANDNLLQ